MKKIKQKQATEIAEFYCDNCGEEAVSFFKFDFGYGSSRDMSHIDGDFCEKCGEKFRKYILKKYKNIRCVGLYE